MPAIALQNWLLELSLYEIAYLVELLNLLMETTKTEYTRRKSEVDKYIEATALLDKGACEIVCTDILQ